MTDYKTEPIIDKNHPLYGKARRVIISEEKLEEMRERFNERAEAVHRDYVRKVRQAEIDAPKVILTR